jgi:hypothetical protein
MKPFTREKTDFTIMDRKELNIYNSVSLKPLEGEITDLANRMRKENGTIFATLSISTLRKSKETQFSMKFFAAL